MAGFAVDIAPLMVGYFNDQQAPANPTSYSQVGQDEQSRLLSPYASKDTDVALNIKIVPTLDPWSPTSAPTTA